MDLKTVTGMCKDFGNNSTISARIWIAADKEQAQPRAEPQVEFPQGNKGTATTNARLVNRGPPLMDLSTGTPGYVTAPSSPKDAETAPTSDYIVRPRRHDFPRFAGDKPLLWIDLILRCTRYLNTIGSVLHPCTWMGMLPYGFKHSSTCIGCSAGTISCKMLWKSLVRMNLMDR